MKKILLTLSILLLLTNPIKANWLNSMGVKTMELIKLGVRGADVVKSEALWTSVKSARSHGKKRLRDLYERAKIKVTYKDWVKGVAVGMAYALKYPNQTKWFYDKYRKAYFVLIPKYQRALVLNMDLKIITTYPRTTPKKGLKLLSTKDVKEIIALSEILNEKGLEVCLGLFI